MILYTEYTDNGRNFTIHVKGKFDFQLMARFRQAYGGYKPNVVTFTVDFREAESIDSAGLGMLLNMRKFLGVAGGEKSIRLIHCREEIRAQLIRAKFEQLFEIV
ncbi:STAS domain-containing protein [Aliidiomarina quisquiliarum]|uniref:STAS domain-containing protein n=1 Tax=Aliidiomarina quisquiliarum TaxID=2938947 RepID=UPI00208E69C1|nr:STAS domain-containing protein [Aliidiomarina quisquiliarum]MCO4320109.1 STAS domain-containing protein [Aliidiomarina quisquiliarum]